MFLKDLSGRSRFPHHGGDAAQVTSHVNVLSDGGEHRSVADEAQQKIEESAARLQCV
jgi:hypothetical protein